MHAMTYGWKGPIESIRMRSSFTGWWFIHDGLCGNIWLALGHRHIGGILEWQASDRWKNRTTIENLTSNGVGVNAASYKAMARYPRKVPIRQNPKCIQPLNAASSPGQSPKRGFH